MRFESGAPDQEMEEAATSAARDKAAAADAEEEARAGAAGEVTFSFMSHQPNIMHRRVCPAM